MQLMVSSVSEKQANYAVKFSQQDDADMVIAHSIALLRSTFPNSNAE